VSQSAYFLSTKSVDCISYVDKNVLMVVSPEDFEKLELDLSCFELEINGVPIWERVRFGVYRELRQKTGAGQAHTRNEEGIRTYFNGVMQWGKNWIYKNPFLSGEHQYMFVGHPRRKLEDDGYWWDVYCDPIHDETDLDYIHFETPHLMSHHTPAKTEHLRYLDAITYTGTIQRKLGLRTPSIGTDASDHIAEIESEIVDRFGVRADVEGKIRTKLHVRNTTLGLYKRLLDRVNPDVVILVVSYGKETFIEACKQKEIPVVELQHGVIYDHHFGYSFPHGIQKETFPDYLLTFGAFWNENARFPLPDDRLIPVGYPYLNQSVDQYDDVTKHDQLLFISQGTIGEQLSKFAMEVSTHSNLECDIVYKLHPGEYDRWRDEYPWLLGADFKIVDSSDRQLYALFAESTAQIGVSSTAVYEGLAFGLETFVYDCHGSSVLQPLVDDGSASKVASVDQLVSLLGSGKVSFNHNYYFELESIERICRVIKHISDMKTTYD